jgi:glycosyltransferase involved in cell wall biosynthesis
MGKKTKKPMHLIKPLVSICTPTFNRRPFIKTLIKCFEHQTYPKDKMEWIIIDDGTDKIEDLVKDIPQVKYYKYDEQMVLGKKRNIMHEKCNGDIIVYMDDDDYYPPERVSHSVEMLLTHPKALCAGTSEIYIYFKHIKQMYQFGPYGPNHATAGTFAFKKELLNDNSYDDNAALAEEKHFLKNYTVPFVQLEPKKTILVFSHIHNTFDKKTLLDNPHPDYCKPSDKKVEDFVKTEELKDFFMNIDDELEKYDFGKPINKPEVLRQTNKIAEERKKMVEEARKNNEGKIIVEQNGKQVVLNNEQIVEILKQQNQKIQELTKKIMVQESIIQSYRNKQTGDNVNIQKDNNHDDENSSKLMNNTINDITDEDREIINQINN